MSSGVADRLVQAPDDEIAAFPAVFGDPEKIISFARLRQPVVATKIRPPTI
jgi:hypothetical protein